MVHVYTPTNKVIVATYRYSWSMLTRMLRRLSVKFELQYHDDDTFSLKN